VTVPAGRVMRWGLSRHLKVLKKTKGGGKDEKSYLSGCCCIADCRGGICRCQEGCDHGKRSSESERHLGRDFDIWCLEAKTAPCSLEILSDKVPVKGKLTIDVPQEVANIFSGTSGKQSAENNEGKLTKQGSLIWTSGDAAGTFVEVWFNDAKKLQLFTSSRA